MISGYISSVRMRSTGEIPVSIAVTGNYRNYIVFADKVSYNGIRWSDFASDAFESRLQMQLELKNKIIAANGSVQHIDEIPQDIKDIAPDVLRHRLILTYEADAEGVDADAIVRRVLDAVRVP